MKSNIQNPSSTLFERATRAIARLTGRQMAIIDRHRDQDEREAAIRRHNQATERRALSRWMKV